MKRKDNSIGFWPLVFIFFWVILGLLYHQEVYDFLAGWMR